MFKWLKEFFGIAEKSAAGAAGHVAEAPYKVEPPVEVAKPVAAKAPAKKAVAKKPAAKKPAAAKKAPARKSKAKSV